MFCQPGVLDYFKDYDFIVINCGHHPAAASEYSFRKYRELVNHFFSEMKSRGVIGKRQLYWVESVAIPLHQDHNVIDYKDWRTYHRLLLFDNIVKQALKSFNCARVVPAFQSTLAIFDKLCDCGHYPGGARLPQLFGLLDQIKVHLRDDTSLHREKSYSLDCIGFGCGPG